MLSYILSLFILAVVLAGVSLGPDGTGIGMNYYDSVMHLLAGIGLGFFFHAFALSTRSERWRSRVSIAILVLIVGVVWEIFEIFFNLTGYEFGTLLYYLDTVKDLILDVVGAILVAHIMSSK